MNRRYTGAEALELAAKATKRPGQWGAVGNETLCFLYDGKGAVIASIEGHSKLATGTLLAAAPDLAESLAAVEAERDEAQGAYLSLEANYNAQNTTRIALEAERDALRAKLHDAHVALAATAMGSDTTRTTIRDYLKALDEYNEIGDGAVVAEYEYALSTLREAAK